jgi:glycosyltransferase involved in cell wall biosynthesis
VESSGKRSLLNAATVAGAPKLIHVSTSDTSIAVLLLNQLHNFRRAGYEVAAVCSPGPLVERVQQAGIAVHCVKMIRAFTPMHDLRAFWCLYKVFRRERPAIVHTHTPKAALLAQYAALAARVPIRVHTIHGLYFPGHMTKRTRWFYVMVERVTMRFVHLALSQNPEDIPTAIQDRICRPDRIHYLGNGIDLSRFHPRNVSTEHAARLREELGLPQTGRVVGIVGRVNREKGYLEFFDAAKLLAAQFRDVQFLIVGQVEPEKSNALDPIALTHERALEGRIVYAGLRDEMPELYHLMDVLVLPSHREGYPRAPMEASAMGRPVVATDIRGCRQVVVHGVTGFLVPLGDVKALVGRVAELLTHPDQARRMGESGRDLAVKRFDEQQVILRTLESYNRLHRDHEHGKRAHIRR